MSQDLYFPDNCLTVQAYLNAKLGYNEDTREYFWSYRPISPQEAALVIALTKQQRICFIEFNDEFSPHLKNPLIWSFSAWTKECDRRNREKIASDKRRIQRFMDEANSKICGKAIAEFANIELDKAILQARVQIDRGRLDRLVAAFGVTRVITREEEL